MANESRGTFFAIPIVSSSVCAILFSSHSHWTRARSIESWTRLGPGRTRPGWAQTIWPSCGHWSRSFDPLEQQGVRPEMSVAALELRSVVCLPLIQIRSGTSEDTHISSTVENTVGLLYMDSRLSPADLSQGNRELLQTLAIEAST